jgi:hypothetical protein
VVGSHYWERKSLAFFYLLWQYRFIEDWENDSFTGTQLFDKL